MNVRPVNAYVLAGIGIGSAVYLALKNKQHLKRWAGMLQSNKKVPEKAGNPDPLDIPDNKMVDEGALTSIHYFNENRQS
ncbi:hypothetical protein [Bacillus sp. NPDC077027]|uniref:hypothetical protein n=1 Tax=Bacillus sp. NPDC077027 TaxID=3390548 RepID=UPI003D07D511